MPWRGNGNNSKKKDEEEEELMAMSSKPNLKMAMRMDSCLLGEEASGEALAQALDRGNLHLFTEIVSSEGYGGVDFDVNEELPERDFSTPLHLAVASGREDFVSVLLRHPKIDPNRPNRTGKRFPLHVAAEKGQARLVLPLLRSGADPDARMENGSSALHVLAARSAARWVQDEGLRPTVRREFVECARMLLEAVRPGANIDATNSIGVTPVAMAVEKGSQELVTFLLDRGAYVDSETEEMLDDKMPDLLAKRDLSSNRKNRDTAESKLFQLLYEAEGSKAFIDAWREAERNNNAKIDPDAHDGRTTFLQLACDRGMEAVAEFLLSEAGSDPNACAPNLPVPPLVLAGHHGYHALVRLFRDHSAKNGFCVDFGASDEEKDETVLHRALKAESKAHLNFSGRDYGRCLALLLDPRQPAVARMIQPAIDKKDQLGNTPLHVAAFTSNEDAIRRLLRCGANIGASNAKGATPIDAIAPEIMEEFLDECLMSERAPVDDNFRLMFKYAFLGPPLRREWKREQLEEEKGDGDEDGEQAAPMKALPEAEPLWYLSQSERHRHLLTHPIISSFLCLKWRRIRPYYYVNLAFYLTFVALLTGFLLLRAGNAGKREEEETGKEAQAFFRWSTFAFLVLLALRELFQALVSFRRYLFSLENLLEVSMIIVTFVLLLGDLEDQPKAVRGLSATALLFSWAEMVMMLGRHPKLSTFITMISTVSLNFFYFLVWYSSIIVAFGLTFFIVFRRVEEDKNEFYSSVSSSLFKTVIMSLTGEMEFEGIEFGGIFASALFLLYVFFVLLVLVNLLNGLAVSDIAEIQKHAEIVSHVSRVELISYTESMLLGDPFSFLSNWPPGPIGRRLPDGSCLRGMYNVGPIRKAVEYLIGSTLLFQQRLRSKIAVFVPNQTSYEDSLPGAERDDLRLDRSILSQATDIVVRRQKEEDEARLEAVEKALKLLARQNNHIIELLSERK